MRPEKALVFRTHLEESGMQIRGNNTAKNDTELKILKALKTLGVGESSIFKLAKCDALLSALQHQERPWMVAVVMGGDESGADSDSRQQTAPWAADSQGWN